MASVVTMKMLPSVGLMPLANMWCPQTRKLKPAMVSIDPTMYL